ncbi:Glu/Leu/Phe/Val dehydrogenase [Tropicibacter sp. R16_0]|uniref:Leu/Phe/Val dehydrogenase n=1 Tax=Tropicibacter sp. R16_0 TaxID=2821102 RepID=UPI001AD9E140|nr:Glu/Leu/Phe/Val dehydrogenase [Tropicibacter sp. R16_0]MBO9452222.1 Glu/Leu/Phe/Val dehydrogenase [Tropicibacter sp. R16_0]
MIFDHPDFDAHEQVIFCNDPTVGLKAIIALHSTALGPAAGGCRMHPYESEDEALTDVLRLSKGMTYKNAVAGLPLGGGKCVIIADPNDPKKPDLLRAFAAHVQSLAGRYWTAIDIGVGPEDADILAEQCDYIFARASQYEPGFNPSEFTALGGFMGIKAVADTVFGRSDLKGLRVAVQGLGATGYALSEHLHKAGAELVVADVRQDAVDRLVSEFGATPADPNQIHAADVDIFAPCALGAGLNDQTIPEIKAKAICGLANNQLAEDRHGEALRQAGIAYVPDYVVNAGGMIGASTVIFTEPSRAASIKQIESLQPTIKDILIRAKREGKPSSAIADAMARAKIKPEGIT